MARPYSKYYCLESVRIPRTTFRAHLPVLLAELQLEMQYLRRQIEASERLIVRIACDLEACRRLVAILSIGPLRTWVL
jgi:hypothetical protein